MINLDKLKNDFEGIAERLAYRGINRDYLLKINEENEKRKQNIALINELRSERNKLSSERIINNKDVSVLKERIKILEDELQTKLISLEELCSQLPNIPALGTPTNEEGNLVKREFQSSRMTKNSLPGEIVLDKLGMIDEKSAVKIAGSKFVVYRGFGVQLLQALVNFFLTENSRKGYELISAPYLANNESLYNTGQLPKFSDDLFKIKDSNLILIPTSEVTLVNLYKNEIIDFQKLPIKMCSYSPCFRAEAGSAGQENKGLIRLHQFNKVELVKIVAPENSYAELEELVKDACSLLEKLDISYRVIDLCHEELGVSAAKTYDIEIWLPVSKKWMEISSCSNCEDFQANRSSIRSKLDGKKVTLHTLNGSALAIDRLILAICEYYYNEKAEQLEIPDCLGKYLNL